QFGTLNNLLANVDKVPGKKQQSLRESGEVVKLSRRLVRLDADMDIACDWDAWKLGPIDTERVLGQCRAGGFQSLGGEIRAVARAATPVQSDLFSGAPEEELFPFGANERPLTPQPPLPPRGEGEQDSDSPLPPVGEGPGVRGAAPGVKKEWNATYH